MSIVFDAKIMRSLREVGLLCFATTAVFLLMALSTFSHEDAGWSYSGTGNAVNNACGVLGAWMADFLLSIFGLMAYLFPVILFWHGYWLFYQQRTHTDSKMLVLRWLGFIITLSSGSALLFLHLPRTRINLPHMPSGYWGQELGEHLFNLLGNSGATLTLLAALFGSITLSSGISWLQIIDIAGEYTLKLSRFILHRCIKFYLSVRANKAKQSLMLQYAEIKSAIPSKSISSKHKTKIAPAIMPIQNKESLVDANILPSLALLDEHINRSRGFSAEALRDMSQMVEFILLDFNIEAKVVAVNPGPVVTRFELQLAPGIKVSRVSGLTKDVARALAVTSVRIVEVIPGKPVIGLEIPNEEREMVSLQELLASNDYAQAKSPLSLVLGKDISGLPVIADLGKMPHVLVAGTTGSGKSVAINAMILSLLYKSTPDQVRMIMVDPKMLELSVYEGIPHLLAPVVTDMKKAADALRWCVVEMDRRYELMSKLGVRNLAGFNKLVKTAQDKGEPIRDPLFELEQPLAEGEKLPSLTTLPSIVIIIDELADMMMIVGKKVEELIARLAQKARASGLHLILATQRPSVDVLTGLIKANVPTRISFQVSSKIDSRTILDQGGAESLLGNGDMLYMPSGTSIPIRAHGAFVADHEVHKIVAFLKQAGTTSYLDLKIAETNDTKDGDVVMDLAAEADPIYDQAVMFVTASRKVSISSVQRKFKVGYNRAARIIEAMEVAGVVSRPEHNGFREVLAPPPP